MQQKLFAAPNPPHRLGKHSLDATVCRMIAKSWIDKTGRLSVILNATRQKLACVPALESRES